ncbi:MAG: outer membrane beta-barrel protein [Marinilabiliaceae bacterium]|nr:outer membrane beta-barrel protein [Marinilabiliaceae bacterium]
MKKLLLSLSFVLTTCIIANSQLFVGGSFGFSSDGGSNSSGGQSVDKDKENSFLFSPKGGYFINENFCVGAQIMFSTYKTEEASGDYEKESAFAFVPFARYYAFKMNKLSVFGQADLGFSSGSSEVKYGATTIDGPKRSGFGFSVTPGLSYKLSDKIELEAAINLLSLSYSSVTEKEDYLGNETEDKTTSFEFGADMDNILTTGNVTIGMIYKF